jgi:phosphoenolpyruvate carboxylase
LRRNKPSDGYLPVVPLFTTLADLDHSTPSMDALLSVLWYRGHLHTEFNCCQEHMLALLPVFTPCLTLK